MPVHRSSCGNEGAGIAGLWDRSPVTPKDPDVSGWVPAFLPADDQLDRQAARLRSLTGHRIAETWTVWSLEHDEWFADLPVVLRLDDGPQLEVCWEKFDQRIPHSRRSRTPLWTR